MLQCTPTLAHEETLWQQGFRAVVGVDEAGRGALAGPVVAGAAIIPPFCVLEGIWAAVRDSKQLAPARRAALALEIMAQGMSGIFVVVILITLVVMLMGKMNIK